MSTITRRSCLQALGLAIPATFLAPRGFAAAEPSATEQKAIAAIAKAFMEKFQVPALSVAFGTDASPLFSAAYGMADKEGAEKAMPEHRFRIASVAKPITAVAIFRLIEQGKLELEEPVFGNRRHFDSDLPASQRERLEKITLHHLLDHTCGGWGNNRNDPMFMHPELEHRELIVRTLEEQPLAHDPGTRYSYSNFGYCLLGRIIEKVSRKSYTSFVEDSIFKPAGIKGMELAGNTRDERAKNEVIYYEGDSPYGMNVRRMDSHGGWIASPADLVKFLVHSGKTGGLLKPDSIATMTTAPACHEGYACGWAVNGARNRWHNGSLPGTSSIAVRTSGGMSWAALTNVRREGIDLALDQMMWQMVKAVPAWKA